MMKRVNPYETILKLSWYKEIDYRFNFIFDLICNLLPIVAMIFLWKAVFGESAKIGNFNFNSMVTYIVISRILHNIIVPDFFFDVTEEIKSGSLSNYIIKPISYLKLWFYKALGGKSQSLMLSVIPMVVIYIFFRNYLVYNFNLLNVMFFIVISIAAYILYYLIYMIISLLSFWFYEISSWFYTFSFIIEFLSGVIIPISLLPDILVPVLKFLPFNYLIYFPISLLIGNIGLAEILAGLATQIAWILILYTVMKIIWYFGRKKYDAFGG